ncbi:MAG: alanine--tRNA ligase [Firmicutes bacterium]|nr:alanine--tRNA ligase [Bacillota bacterium]
MHRLSGNEIREKFLEFFESKGHLRLPGASLIPKNDPTLLLTGAGMVPFKPYFLGQEKPPRTRITTCQPCIRTPDIDRVGYTDRHGTFFEMLGNFSFGDYFKSEAIAWAWEFVTQVFGLPEDRLWVSVYEKDDEAAGIWHEEVGVPKERIVRLGKDDNFWEIGVGPCGPCSEIHLDRGPEHGCGRPDCSPGCDCDRFMEIWNLVFIQFRRDEEGNYHELESKNIDTGMGLERAAVILQGVNNIFETDLVKPILDKVAELADTSYGADPKKDVSLRVITDHVRGITFMVKDGIVPSNEGRGYVLRRLLRRAVRHGRLLQIQLPFLAEVVETVVAQMGQAYPDLVERKDYILNVISQEEERFRQTLDQGVELLEKTLAELKSKGKEVLPGFYAFRLYDTYGFPFELTKEIAGEAGFNVDEDGFHQAMDQQRQRAREARGDSGYVDLEEQFYTDLAKERNLRSKFVGYDQTTATAAITALVKDGKLVDSLSEGEEGQVVLDVTPFYAESGGQVADTGKITGENGELAVTDVKRVGGSLIAHTGKVKRGQLATGDKVEAEVAAAIRLDTARNHTATHLLHKALRSLLGEHATQAGSLVAPEYLRFDFQHYAALTPEQLAEVEERVNAEILANHPVTTEVTSYQEAVDKGAMALFGEKYGDRVRVVQVGSYSTELCGGTHVCSTGQIGLFKIISESGVAAGTRRIEALTGRHALRWLNERNRLLEGVASQLKVNPEQVQSKVARLVENLKSAEKELKNLKHQLAQEELDNPAELAQDVQGVKLLARRIDDLDVPGMRNLVDELRAKLGSGVVVLGSAAGGKVVLVAGATKDVVENGIHAGKLVGALAKLVGGGGGGRPDMAQAGGKDPAKLDEALASAAQVLAEQLS